jgi:hypothetical protein
MSVPARFVHVGFSFSGQEPPAAELEAIFSTAMDWVRYDVHCWILYTTTELETWRDKIRSSPAIKAQDSFFLCDFTAYSGYQHKLVWDFLDKAR